MKVDYTIRPIWDTFWMDDGSIIEGPSAAMGRFCNLPVVFVPSMPPDRAALVPARRPGETDSELAARSVVLINIATADEKNDER